MSDKQQYEDLVKQIQSVLKDETNLVSVMSTISSMLKYAFQKYYWVGFYLEEGGLLKVGPYQGTLGCLSIEPERGVCGRAFRTSKTQIVDDVHSDPEHIACDAATRSEIVIPVLCADGSVFGVLDVDSDQPSAFNEVDLHYLEMIIQSTLVPLL